MSSTNTAATRCKRFFIFSIMPLLMLPFIILYAYSAWWLLRLLDGFPGGFFKQHPNLTLTALVVIACCLLIITAQALWDTLRARFT